MIAQSPTSQTLHQTGLGFCRAIADELAKVIILFSEYILSTSFSWLTYKNTQKIVGRFDFAAIA
jgi:hypothetical protein